jgi:hypothetical protein
MRGSTSGNHASQIPSDDNVGICTTNTPLWSYAKGINPTRPHNAITTAQTHVAKSALRLLRLESFPNRLNLIGLSFVEQQLSVFSDSLFIMFHQHNVLPLYPMSVFRNGLTQLPFIEFGPTASPLLVPLEPF